MGKEVHDALSGTRIKNLPENFNHATNKLQLFFYALKEFINFIPGKVERKKLNKNFNCDFV